MLSFPPSYYGGRWSDDEEARAEAENEREENRMPQYDPNPTILRERCYAMAQQLCAAEWGATPEDFEEATDYELLILRERIRDVLLEEFLDIEGPEIAELMDEALHDLGFPLHRVL